MLLQNKFEKLSCLTVVALIMSLIESTERILTRNLTNVQLIINSLLLYAMETELSTHIAVLVRDVVSEFKLVEGHWLAHPLLPLGRAVRVDVHALGHLRVGLARHHPAGVVELVAALVDSDDVHQQDVLGCLIQAVHPHFERRKHPPVANN